MMPEGRVEHRMRLENDVARLIEGRPEYIRYYVSSMTDLSPRTQKEYVIAVNHMLSYFKDKGIDISDLRNIKSLDLVAYYKSLEYKEKNGEKKATSFSYRKQRWSSINHFFSFAVEYDLIDSNPMSKVKRAKGSDNVHQIYMEQSDIHRVLRNAFDYSGEHKERNMAVLCILLQTGMRVSALTEININDVTFEYGDGCIIGAEVRVCDKNNTYFTHYVTREAAVYIHSWIVKRNTILSKAGKSTEGALFLNQYNERISVSGVEKLVSKFSPKIEGKQITPHKYRATYANQLYKATKDGRYVQEMMGHKSFATTQVYLKSDKGSRKNAANIMGNVCFN